jgi:environmental stress-induced protein Ves
MPHRLLSPADYLCAPWRNGGGRTTEIAAYPPGSSIDRFDWRVSIAEVDRDGPFSTFPGVDRILVLLAGGGLRLSGSGEPIELRALGEPCAFDGGAPLQCTLFRGPVQNFNLMIRRARVRGEVVVVRDEHAVIAPARFLVCHVRDGAYECLLPGHAPINVAAGHTLAVEADDRPAPLHVNPIAAGAFALVAVTEFA